jgi:5-methylcytosine-specific restriction protein A
MSAADRDRRYKSSQWQRVRLTVLKRDGWVCQIRGPHCTMKATQADHIVEVRLGGSFYDPDNLRGACNNCNQYRKRRAARPSTHQPSRAW